jgi:hypothetical protein
MKIKMKKLGLLLTALLSVCGSYKMLNLNKFSYAIDYIDENSAPLPDSYFEKPNYNSDYSDANSAPLPDSYFKQKDKLFSKPIDKERDKLLTNKNKSLTNKKLLNDFKKSLKTFMNQYHENPNLVMSIFLSKYELSINYAKKAINKMLKNHIIEKNEYDVYYKSISAIRVLQSMIRTIIYKQNYLEELEVEYTLNELRELIKLSYDIITYISNDNNDVINHVIHFIFGTSYSEFIDYLNFLNGLKNKTTKEMTISIKGEKIVVLDEYEDAPIQNLYEKVLDLKNVVYEQNSNKLVNEQKQEEVTSNEIVSENEPVSEQKQEEINSFIKEVISSFDGMDSLIKKYGQEKLKEYFKIIESYFDNSIVDFCIKFCMKYRLDISHLKVILHAMSQFKAIPREKNNKYWDHISKISSMQDLIEDVNSHIKLEDLNKKYKKYNVLSLAKLILDFIKNSENNDDDTFIQVMKFLFADFYIFNNFSKFLIDLTIMTRDESNRYITRWANYLNIPAYEIVSKSEPVSKQKQEEIDSMVDEIVSRYAKLYFLRDKYGKYGLKENFRIIESDFNKNLVVDFLVKYRLQPSHAKVLLNMMKDVGQISNKKLNEYLDSIFKIEKLQELIASVNKHIGLDSLNKKFGKYNVLKLAQLSLDFIKNSENNDENFIETVNYLTGDYSSFSRFLKFLVKLDMLTAKELKKYTTKYYNLT